MNPALLNLQHLDSSILALSRAKKALDDGTAARARRDEMAQLLAAARAEATGVAATRRARETEQEGIETKITRQKARLAGSSSAGDVAALERDLVGLSHARGALDETILALMDEGEALQGRVTQLEAEAKVAEAEAARVEAEFAAKSIELDAQLATQRAKRPALAAKLSALETEKYVASFKKHGGLGVSEAVKGACNACGTTMSHDFLKVAPREPFPQCESCARLIYVSP